MWHFDVAYYGITIGFGYLFGRFMVPWPNMYGDEVKKALRPHAAMVEGVWKRPEDEYDNIYPS